MTADDGLGELLLQVEEQGKQGGPLLEGAGVLGLAVGVEAALVADAYRTAVEGAAMGAYLVKAAVLGQGAVLADVEVVAHFDETSRQVVAPELLGGVVLGFAGGGAVEDEVTDRGGGHVYAVLYLCKEVVLGGYGGTSKSHGKIF